MPRSSALHGTLIMKDSVSAAITMGLGAVSASSDPLFPHRTSARVLRAGLKELGLAEHQLRFTCRVHLHDTRKEQEMAMRVYSHLKRYPGRLFPGCRAHVGALVAGPHWDSLQCPRDHCVQHLPDGSVTVSPVQAAAHSEDPGTKVLLASWTYQVRAGLVGSPITWGRRVRGQQQALLACGCRTRS